MNKSSSPLPIRGVILDMDGVLWSGDQPLGDLPSIFAEMEQRGWKISLATNNSSRTIPQYVDRLAGFGVIVRPDQVVNSSIVTAAHLKRLFPDGGPVFVLGEEALANTMADMGFYSTTESPLAVVVGIDFHLTYDKLAQATLLVRSGALLIATNADTTFPTSRGLLPGTGAILAALVTATKKQPLIIGKPNPTLYRFALDRMGLLPEEVLVVGDRLEIDIAGAQALRCRTGLVLSGATALEQVADWNPPPEWVASDLTSLLKCIQ